ncbi:hypothetical protein [Rhodoferax aquaticus]|uniref:Uncharacterized protein n=1 Tax=Rhodoferax aquaticus TaxID=2527691 RepID=A0A515ENZ4_9BURK|nr:hypothetical protein [Rhodoferax aquaticus]QDL54384.1 hypothetical protein EXZ61_09540 [Rhodoferax aquaticus]
MLKQRKDYFAVLVLASVLVALVPTVWPVLDLAVANYFFQAADGSQSATWTGVVFVNRYVPLMLVVANVELTGCA